MRLDIKTLMSQFESKKHKKDETDKDSEELHDEKEDEDDEDEDDEKDEMKHDHASESYKKLEMMMKKIKEKAAKDEKYCNSAYEAMCKL